MPSEPRGRGRGNRRARFELDFGEFDDPAGDGGFESPTDSSRRSRTRDYETAEPRRTRTRTSDLSQSRQSEVDETLYSAGPSRSRSRTQTGTQGGSRASDPVEDEIEALERFEDAIESVRRPSDRTPSDLGPRVLVAIPAGIIAILLVAEGGPIFAAGIAIFGVIGIWELTRMFAEHRPSVFAGAIATLGIIGAAYFAGREGMATAIAASIPLIFLFVAAARPPGAMTGVAVTLLGVVWLGVALGHAILLRDMDHGGGLVIAVLVGTFLGDTGAYLGGRLFGSHKLAPSISPNKTVEGLLIGVITAIVATWFAGLYQDWLSGTDALLLGLAVAIVAPIGDLFESFIKRGASTKDSGGLFGPHGGVLDRLDAAMFAIVAGYYVWLIIGA